MDGTHGPIDDSSHVVGCESADEVVKGRRRWAYSKEERDFDKYEDQTGDSVSELISEGLGGAD